MLAIATYFALSQKYTGVIITIALLTIIATLMSSNSIKASMDSGIKPEIGTAQDLAQLLFD